MDVESAGKKEEFVRVYDELHSLNAIYCTEEMTMLTLSIAIIGLGWQFENPILITLTFVILLPLQILLNSHRDQMVRNAAYLIVFHEAFSADLQFERSLNYFNKNAGKKNLLWYVARFNSTYLGIIALVSITLMWKLQLSQRADIYFIVSLAGSFVAQICLVAVNAHLIFRDKIDVNYKRTFVEAYILSNIERRMDDKDGTEINQLLEDEVTKAIKMYAKVPRLIREEALDKAAICKNLNKILKDSQKVIRKPEEI